MKWLRRLRILLWHRWCPLCSRWAPRWSDGTCTNCQPLPEVTRRAIMET